ncbi:MAG: hypothetical protein ACRD8Z_14750 [Nitrososphaeraceae archaeon]
MAVKERKPLAFISTSLRKEDNLFVKLVEKITRENGFEPMGTVGLHSAAPIPVWEHIMENISIFKDLKDTQKFTLVKAIAFDCDIVLLDYEVMKV